MEQTHPCTSKQARCQNHEDSDEEDLEDDEYEDEFFMSVPCFYQIINTLGYVLIMCYGAWLHLTMEVQYRNRKWYRGFWDINIFTLSPQIHGILMMIIYVLVGRMMMMYNVCMCPEERKRLHRNIASAMGLMFIIALKAAFDHNQRGIYGEGGIRSFHSKVGMVGIFLFMLLNSFGIFLKYLRNGGQCNWIGTQEDHIYFSKMFFLLIGILEQLGIYSMSRYNCTHYFNRFIPGSWRLQCLLGIKIMHAFYGILVNMLLYMFPCDICIDPCGTNETSL